MPNGTWSGKKERKIVVSADKPSGLCPFNRLFLVTGCFTGYIHIRYLSLGRYFLGQQKVYVYKWAMI